MTLLFANIILDTAFVNASFGKERLGVAIKVNSYK